MDNADLPTFNPHDVMRHLADLGQRMKDAQARIKGMETKVSQQGHVLSEVRTGCASTRRYTWKTRRDHNKLGMAYAELKQRVERLEAWTREEIFARTAMDEPEDDTLPATPALVPEDDAAKWETLADTTGIGPKSAKEVVANAIALGLAAPADRVVCAVTDGLISAIIEAAKPNPIYAYTMGTPRERVRAVLEAAYWIAPAGYATEGE
jgi:uncharacterized coiled-coil protein SlyX